MTHDDTLRVPPHSIEAEQAVLGGLMLQPASLAKISDWISERDFFRRNHQAIYRAITELSRRGDPCDAVTLGDWFQSNGIDGIAGGVGYIIELADSTPGAANIVAYAEIVKQKADLRDVIDAGSEMVSAAFDGRRAAMDIASAATQRLGRIAGASTRSGLQPTKPLLKAWFENLAKLYETGSRVTGLPTPWRDLNDVTHGLQPGELILLPARPNIGKSVAGFQLAAFTALQGKRTAVFSLEMTHDQVMRRCISSVGRVPHEWLKAPHHGEDSDVFWSRVSDAAALLAAAPLLIDAEPSLTIDQIRGRALREHLRAPIELVVIDHAHIVKRPGRNEVTELGEISRGGKALAKELDCPVVMLAQLSRSLEQRSDKRPVMSDLRSSGELEQDADLILFMYRDDYYNPSTHLKGVVEVEIGKGRDVRTGQRVYFQNRYDEMRLDDWIGPLPDRDDETVSTAPARRGFRRRGFDAGRAASGDSE